jgi:hypothetical protein
MSRHGAGLLAAFLALLLVNQTVPAMDVGMHQHDSIGAITAAVPLQPAFALIEERATGEDASTPASCGSPALADHWSTADAERRRAEIVLRRAAAHPARHACSNVVGGRAARADDPDSD